MSFQNKKNRLRDLSFIAIFIVLTATSALISFPIFSVPFTLQVPIVILTGYILGSRRGFIAQLGYLILGIIGLPIFAAAKGGPAIIMSPTFGYLLSFPIAAILVGFLRDKFDRKKLVNVILIFFSALIPIYLFGFLYIYLFSEVIIGKNLSPSSTFQIAVLPFIIFDLLKIFLAAIIARALEPLALSTK